MGWIAQSSKKMHFQIRVVCNVVIHVELAGLVHNSLLKNMERMHNALEGSNKGGIWGLKHWSIFTEKSNVKWEQKWSVRDCSSESRFPQETSWCQESPERRHAMVSFPGSLLSLKVCMLITSSVLTMAGGWGFCFRRRWHFRDTLSSSTITLQNERCAHKSTSQTCADLLSLF